MPKSKKPTFVPKPPPAEQQQLLRETVFGPDSPGTVVHDLQTLLELVGDAGVEAGGKHHVLPMKILTDLNLRMRWQARLDLQRPQMHSYPNLQGLHLIARASGLIGVRGAGSKARLVRDPEAYDEWMELNDAERYFCLFDAWLLHASPGMIGERPPVGSYFLDDKGFLSYLLQLWERMGEQGKSVSQKDRAAASAYALIDYDRYTLVLMAQFGLVRIEQGKPIKGRPWMPVSMHRTPFGGAVVAVLEQLGDSRAMLQRLLDTGTILPQSPLNGAGKSDKADGEEDGEEDGDEDGAETEDESAGGDRTEAGDESDQGPPAADEGPFPTTEICFDDLRALFAPYVPAWQESLCVRGGGGFRDGVFVFKASVGSGYKGVWRRIAAPARATLTELAYAVLEAYHFDDDHLWSFYTRDRFGNPVELQHYYAAGENGTPSTSDVLVGEVPLEAGDSMTFLFDYGDRWRFDLLLERIDPPGKSKATDPKLLEKQGAAPAQYRDWHE